MQSRARVADRAPRARVEARSSGTPRRRRAPRAFRVRPRVRAPLSRADRSADLPSWTRSPARQRSSRVASRIRLTGWTCDAVRASFAATLHVPTPALAGRARSSARDEARHSRSKWTAIDPPPGVAFEAGSETPSATPPRRMPRRRPSAAKQRHSVEPFPPRHIRCPSTRSLAPCGSPGAAVTKRRRRRRRLAWSHAVADGRAMRAFCELDLRGTLARAAATRRARPASLDGPPRRSATRATTAAVGRVAGARATRARRASCGWRSRASAARRSHPRGPCAASWRVAASFVGRAGHRAHPRGADARRAALRRSDATSTNDVLLAATWTLIAGSGGGQRHDFVDATRTRSAPDGARARFPSTTGAPWRGSSNPLGNASLAACARPRR